MATVLTLKRQMAYLIGGVVSAVILVMSVIILFHLKHNIIEKHIRNAMAITRTISIPVINTLIHSESGTTLYEGYLDNLITHFMEQEPKVLQVRILDLNKQVITERGQNISSVPSIKNSDKLFFGARIFPFKSLGMILETSFELNVVSKSWGTLIIAFDSESTQKEIRNLFFISVLTHVFFY